ncbi:allergen Tha p 1-like [Leptidea sinapis]|uniref:allergen Tha p 1-like n=1 Tax=Leptidea sinapis TaxID=189913 RepID=UPI002138E4CB|nr:allergen Tha p 1-like [Leptidea sinapis]
MKSLAVVCLLALFVFAAARPDVYTDKYDNVDLDEILENKRLFTPYVKCILDQGKCSPDGKELKSHIQEALEENCGKCTDKQKTGTRRVIGHLINHEEEYWNQLKAKYDPKSKYSVKYEEELRSIKAS